MFFQDYELPQKIEADERPIKLAYVSYPITWPEQSLSNTSRARTHKAAISRLHVRTVAPQAASLWEIAR